VASVKATHKVDAKLMNQVEAALKAASVAPQGVYLDLNSIRVRLADTDTQLKAKDAIEKALNPVPADATYSVALNLVSNSPNWLTRHSRPADVSRPRFARRRAFPAAGGHEGGLTKRLDSIGGRPAHPAARQEPPPRRISPRRADLVQRPVSRYRDARQGEAGHRRQPARPGSGRRPDRRRLHSGGHAQARGVKTFQEDALKQNIATLNKRINELAVAEPVIQQQGADRIVVQLPGVQDVARAKDLIGRTATLEVRMVEQPSVLGRKRRPGTDLVPERRRDGSTTMVAVKKLVVLTGDRFNGAQATFDENQRPAVAVQLDAAGGRIMRDVTREYLKKMMAIILIEKGKPEAISVATIQGEFGNRFQITGMFSPEETNTLAILIRSGAVAAPMDIIEERVIGPSLGADNIAKGFNSTLWGFVAISLFMVATTCCSAPCRCSRFRPTCCSWWRCCRCCRPR
jgi:preprotein translocase subunit SecD